MKNKALLVFLLVLFIFSYDVFAQHQRRGRGPGKGDPIEKIEQLEKAKLIEILNMDENTSIKFFARRNEMKQKMDQLRMRADNLVEEMAKQIKDGGIKDDKYVKTNAASLFNINREMIKTREDFVNNLFDLLSVEQVAKFLIFEKRFREEIRELIFRQDE